MAMPKSLVLVRHGQSWLNWVLHMYRSGRGNEVPPGLCGTPGWQTRLTDLGRKQAMAAANLVESLGLDFDRGYCSPYIRTIETALNILPEAPAGFWRIFAQIRERDWGEWEELPSLKEYLERVEYLKLARTEERMFWSPPGGESGHDAILRCRDMVGTLARTLDENIILSCHGELIESLLRMFNDWGTLHDWQENQEAWRYLLEPQNCQVIHLTRINPRSGKTHDYLRWVKSYVPWDEEHDHNRDWAVMERKSYSAEDLRRIVAGYPASWPQ